jgi:hypothetical protein
MVQECFAYAETARFGGNAQKRQVEEGLYTVFPERFLVQPVGRGEELWSDLRVPIVVQG